MDRRRFIAAPAVCRLPSAEPAVSIARRILLRDEPGRGALVLSGCFRNGDGGSLDGGLDGDGRLHWQERLTSSREQSEDIVDLDR